MFKSHELYKSDKWPYTSQNRPLHIGISEYSSMCQWWKLSSFTVLLLGFDYNKRLHRKIKSVISENQYLYQKYNKALLRGQLLRGPLQRNAWLINGATTCAYVTRCNRISLNWIERHRAFIIFGGWYVLCLSVWCLLFPSNIAEITLSAISAAFHDKIL